ncbi:MAG: thymidylate synthase [Chloroflexota bacterium]|nr:thymidylate synthase [Chloroflexota bacterium]
MKTSITDIISHGSEIHPTRGRAKELEGVLLEICNPLARISRTETRGKPFSCIGELIWYLSGSDELDLIAYYLPYYQHYQSTHIDQSYFGAYGPRLFNWRDIDQFSNATNILKSNKWSRRAVIQIFDAADASGLHRDVPCTCTLQFLVRENRLNLIVNMRSNDAFLGLPHDVFCFTMLQEIMARTLECELGQYRHFVGSLHLYCRNESRARSFLDEGWQSTRAAMPPMPACNPWESIANLLVVERQIRRGEVLDPGVLSSLDPYWADLVRLLLIFRNLKCAEKEGVIHLKEEMTSRVYDSFIDDRIARL